MGNTSSLSLSEDKDIFLIGKSGSGKSTTANTLLRRNGFKVSDASSSATTNIDVEWTRYGHYTLKVVDGPGTFDTRYSEEERMKKAVDAFADAFFQCPDGFHALVLVLKYGVRFTKEEQDTVTILKRMFGSDFLQKHGIIVFTDGENYDLNNKNKTFETWCAEQTGALGNLLQECQNKVVLFRNLQPKSHVKSLEKMLTLLQNIPSRYTNRMFEEMKQERLKLIVETKEPLLKESILKRMSIISGNIVAIAESANDPREQMRSIDQLKTDVIKLQEEINREDEGTDVLRGLKQTCKNLLEQIDSNQNRNIENYQKQLENIRREQERAHTASLKERDQYISILEKEKQALENNSGCNII